MRNKAPTAHTESNCPRTPTEYRPAITNPGFSLSAGLGVGMVSRFPRSRLTFHPLPHRTGRLPRPNAPPDHRSNPESRARLFPRSPSWPAEPPQPSPAASPHPSTSSSPNDQTTLNPQNRPVSAPPAPWPAARHLPAIDTHPTACSDPESQGFRSAIARPGPRQAGLLQSPSKQLP